MYNKTNTLTQKKKKKKQQAGHPKKKSKQKMKETAINKESEMGTEAGKQMLKQKQELMKKDMKNIKQPEKKKTLCLSLTVSQFPAGHCPRLSVWKQ